ncbi:MAG TPA: sigma-70 family RNA polymerase sigma factor [Conexibacter sp.]|jgi:RNA polymerase sigma factor (sigma-70 family)|nr:sigma-70 family RNA polymerase sigma factor [Conexibacter sp.]
MSPAVTVRLLATQSDARLVELARHGHERAFEALVQRYRRPLLSWCRRALLPDTRAEDALQQALLQAWLALQQGADVRDPRAWLYRIVHNTALNVRRGSGYDYAELSEALSGARAPQEDLDRRIAVREALAGLAALPEQQREALLRTAVEGASHADAAAEMGVSEGALRGLVYRARATLRTAVTAITPMPLATWAAGAAGHGGGAVAELAVGGGSAGLAGLLAKGGAVAVTAGVLAAGVGTVERHRHATGQTAPRAARAVRSAVAGDAAGAPQTATLVAVAAPVAPGAVDPGASVPHRERQVGGHRDRRRTAALAPATLHGDAPPSEVPARPGDVGGDHGGPSRHGTGHGSGPGDGGSGGNERRDQPARRAFDGGSGDGGHGGSGAERGDRHSGDVGGSRSGGDGGPPSGGDTGGSPSRGDTGGSRSGSDGGGEAGHGAGSQGGGAGGGG